LRLRETGALLFRAPREALFAAARVPVDFDRLFAAAPELLLDRAAVLAERLGAAFVDRLEAGLLERLEADLLERLEAAFVRVEVAFLPPRAPLRAAVFLPEIDFRVAGLRLDPDATFAAEPRVVGFAVLFVPSDFVARDPAADFVAVRRELEAVLFLPDALVRAVAGLRAVLFFCPESLFADAARLREPEAPRRALPLPAPVPALFVERRLAVEPLLLPDALPPPRERFATNLKKRLVPPDST
jgi:hypothetical protein